MANKTLYARAHLYENLSWLDWLGFRIIPGFGFQLNHHWPSSSLLIIWFIWLPGLDQWEDLFEPGDAAQKACYCATDYHIDLRTWLTWWSLRLSVPQCNPSPSHSLPHSNIPVNSILTSPSPIKNLTPGLTPLGVFILMNDMNRHKSLLLLLILKACSGIRSSVWPTFSPSGACPNRQSVDPELI